MTTYFVDTSALGRRYLNEIGTAWTMGWIVPSAGHVIVISDLAKVEMVATFARLQRESFLTPTMAALLHITFLKDITQEYLSVPLDDPTLSTARRLVTQHPLRTLDTIQLASALTAVTLLQAPMTFVSGDNRLLTAAAAEGFAIDNPYLHP